MAIYAKAWEILPSPVVTAAFLFVYGTLRSDHMGPMADRLRREGRLIGPATIAGTLYRIGDYPGLIPGGNARVVGDLYALGNPQSTLAWLDHYEECSPAFPQPWEYRRTLIPVVGPQARVDAWTYVYARDVTSFGRIDGGDFLTPR